MAMAVVVVVCVLLHLIVMYTQSHSQISNEKILRFLFSGGGYKMLERRNGNGKENLINTKHWIRV